MTPQSTKEAVAAVTAAIGQEQASELLETSSLTANEIAGKVGFKHETYFNREFKRVKGLPPIAYRKQRAREK